MEFMLPSFIDAFPMEAVPGNVGQEQDLDH
jgi:hypothetical protein